MGGCAVAHPYYDFVGDGSIATGGKLAAGVSDETPAAGIKGGINLYRLKDSAVGFLVAFVLFDAVGRLCKCKRLGCRTDNLA